MKVAVTQEKAGTAAKTLGLPTNRPKRWTAKARLSQYMEQVGLTHIGQGDLEVTSDLLERILDDLDKVLCKVKEEGDTEKILRVLTRKHAIADSMTKIAEIRIRSQDDSKRDLPRAAANVFPAGVAIGINIAQKEEPTTAKVLELPPAPMPTNSAG